MDHIVIHLISFISPDEHRLVQTLNINCSSESVSEGISLGADCALLVDVHNYLNIIKLVRELNAYITFTLHLF